MADGAGVLARGRPVIVCHVWMCTGTIYSGGNGQGGQRVWCTFSDSTFLKDSIYIELRAERDTVYRTEYRYRTHWRDRVVHDTLETVRVDSVSVPVPVERKLSRWEETKLHYGGFALLAVVVCILIGFGRLVYRLKK